MADNETAVTETPEDKAKATRPAVHKGRYRIISRYAEITAENVIQAVTEANAPYVANRGEIQWLWDYYRGDQPILNRVKEVRPEINNRVVENHAKEAVDFKVGYQLAEPVQYVSRTGEDDEDEVAEQVKRLNTLMYAEGKPEKDHDLFEWMCVCGIGFRFVMPHSEVDEDDGCAPFELYTLDPRDTYVALSPEYHHRPLFADWVSKDPLTDVETHNVYTQNMYYRIQSGQIVEQSPHALGGIPIVEYELNSSRQGVFEPALPILDAINVVVSNRLDGIEQTVQSLMKFINCDIDEAGFMKMLGLGAIKIRQVEGMTADVDYITCDLDQTQTQVTKDDLYQALANIVGMPNTNGTSGSSSDTGTAVMLRDGWTLAESHAKGYELKWKRAERDVLRMVLRICKVSDEPVNLRLRDVEMAFNRRNYENALVKAQVLTSMLAEDRIDPLLAFQSCGLFNDPQAAALQSAAHYDKVQAEAQEKAMQIAAGNAQAVGGGDTSAARAANPKNAGGDGQNEHNNDMAREAQRRNAVRQTAADAS